MSSLLEKIGQGIIDYAYVRSARAFGRSTMGGGRWVSDASTIDYEAEKEIADKAVLDEVWMYVSEKAIVQSMSSLPIGAYKKAPETKGGEWELDKNHWATKLLENPNNYQTSIEFIEAMVYDVFQHGECFIEKGGVNSEKDQAKSLHIFTKGQVEPVPDPVNYIKYYKVKSDKKPEGEPFEPWRIIWLRLHNPTDPFKSLSPSTPAGSAVKQSISVARYAKQFFDNFCAPFGVVETDRRLVDGEYKRIRDQLAKSNKGPKNWWKLMILEGGLKYKAVQMTPKDLALKEYKADLKEQTFAAYGMNDAMAGGSKITSENNKALQKLFWRQTIMPPARRFAQRLTKDLLVSEKGSVRIFFDLTNVEALQEDQEVKSRIAFNLQKSLVFNLDELRATLYKMQPHANGVGKQIFLPSNMITVEALLANGGKPLSGTGPAKPGKPGGPDADSDDEGKKPGANDNKPAKKDIDENWFQNERILAG